MQADDAARDQFVAKVVDAIGELTGRDVPPDGVARSAWDERDPTPGVEFLNNAARVAVEAVESAYGVDPRDRHEFPGGLAKLLVAHHWETLLDRCGVDDDIRGVGWLPPELHVYPETRIAREAIAALAPDPADAQALTAELLAAPADERAAIMVERLLARTRLGPKLGADTKRSLAVELDARLADAIADGDVGNDGDSGRRGWDELRLVARKAESLAAQTAAGGDRPQALTPRPAVARPNRPHPPARGGRAL